MLHAGTKGQAEFSEAPLEVFIQECIQDRVEAAVHVAKSNTQVPAGDHEQILVVNLHHSLDDDEDMDGGPADDESCYHHQYHAGDAPEVSVLLFGAGQQAYTLKAKDHQAVTDGDDQDGNHKGENENTDLGHSIPILWIWAWEFQHADRFA